MSNDEFTVLIPESQAYRFKEFLLSLGVWSVEMVELGGLANWRGVVVPAHTVPLARTLAAQLARANWAAAHQRQIDAHSGGRRSPAGMDGAMLALFPQVKW